MAMLINYHSKDKIVLIFYLIVTILLFSILMGCSVLPTNPDYSYGNLQITSNPVGASIYLDGTYTGFVTPYTLENIVGGSLITLKLNGYLSSNNIIQILPDQLNMLDVELTPNSYPPISSYLTSIKINPESINLFSGQIFNIISIKAFYSDGTNRDLSYPECTLLSINKEVANVSPAGIITGINEGETTIWAIYTENNITKSDSILVNVYGTPVELGSLTGISVTPSVMSLAVGESQNISSITAYYDSGNEININPELCNFNTNNSNVSINNSGLITGISVGNSIITITLEDNGIVKNDTISVTVTDAPISAKSVYRALAIGIGDYIYYGEEGDLIAPPYDVNKMKEIFNDCQFGLNNTGFSKISELKNTQATKSNILQRIQTTFSDATNDDVSYFYFSGHGASLNQTSYLCPADFNGNISTGISVDELESALSAIPGTKVVLIDSCHSGGFIGKDISSNETNINLISEEDFLSNFNESIINSFSDKIITKDLLTSSEYQVLTSSHWYQSSYELYPPNVEPFGVFTQALYEGCGLKNNFPADTNADNKINLNEAYNYIAQWVAAMRVNQNVQIFPLNSSFTIFEY